MTNQYIKCSNQHLNSPILATCSVCHEALYLKENQKIKNYKVIKSITDSPYQSKSMNYSAMISIASKEKTSIQYLIKETALFDQNHIEHSIEHQILSQLSHPSIPKIQEIFTSNEKQYIVMDYIPQPPLSEVIKTSGPFDEELVWEIFTQIVDTIVYLQNQQPAIVHGDVKPLNLLLHEQKIYLIDFDKSNILFNKTSPSMGYTRGYAAPEQVNELNFSTDLYSLGCTCIYLLTGYPPFVWLDKAEHHLDKWYNYCSVSTQFRMLITELIQPSLEQRKYKNAKQLKKEIKNFDSFIPLKSIHSNQSQLFHSISEASAYQLETIFKNNKFFLEPPLAYLFALKSLELELFELTEHLAMNLLENEAWHIESHLLLARMNFAKNKNSQTIKYLNYLKNITTSPIQRYSSQILIANYHKTTGNKLEAIKTLNQIPAHQLMHQDVYLLALLNYEIGEFKLAKLISKNLFSKKPFFQKNLFLLSKICLSSGDHARAFYYLDKTIEIEQDSNSARLKSLYSQGILIALKQLKYSLNISQLNQLSKYLKCLKAFDILDHLNQYKKSIFNLEFKVLKNKGSDYKLNPSLRSKLSIFIRSNTMNQLCIGFLMTNTHPQKNDFLESLKPFSKERFIFHQNLNIDFQRIIETPDSNIISLNPQFKMDDIYNFLINQAISDWILIIKDSDLIAENSINKIKDFFRFKPVNSTVFSFSINGVNTIRIIPNYSGLFFKHNKPFFKIKHFKIQANQINLSHIEIS